MAHSPSNRMQAVLSFIRRRSNRHALKRAYRRSYLQLGLEQLEPRQLLAIDLPAEILVGRTLSAYSANEVQNNQLKLTYSVYNQREIPIDDVRLANTLKPGVTFVAGSQPPNQNGQELTWSLGTIPAYGRASVEITVSLAAGNILQLDEGAQVFGTIDAGVATDGAPAAILRDSPLIAGELASTVDANATDPVIQEKAAELDYDPAKIFAYLDNEVGYESYVGSLRGARGTLWSDAGNSLDEASLGVALFRASGIPARYAHGTLSDANAQALILTMFPEPTQIVGYLAPGTEVADPAHDPTLLSETRDHYWLQIDVGAGFQNADTSGLPGGGIGTSFTTISDTFNEVADSLRHKVRISLDAETYSQATAAFNSTAAVNGSNGLTTSTVLDKTWNAVELVGKPISISQFVDEKNLGGLAFTSRVLTYIPYFLVGDVADPLAKNDEIIIGISFQELLTNFPLGSTILTGLQLNMDQVLPSGGTEHDERMLVDRIGFAARQNSGTGNFAVDANGQPALTNFSTVTLFVGGSEFSAQEPVSLYQNIVSAQSALQAIVNPGLTSLPPGTAAVIGSYVAKLTRLMGYRYLSSMDFSADRAADLAMVNAYWNKARIVLAKVTLQAATANTPESPRMALDLIREFIKVIVRPGQAVRQEVGFQVYYGLEAGEVERAVVASSSSQSSVGKILSVASIFEAAQSQNIAIIALQPQDRGTLAIRIAATPEVLARIDSALALGKFVFAPAVPVLFNGEMRTGWYEVESQTGITIDVLDDGGHQATETTQLAAIALQNAQSIAFGIGTVFGIVVGFTTAKTSSVPLAFVSLVTAIISLSGDNGGVLAGNPVYKTFQAGVGIGLILGGLIALLDPPAEGQFWAPLPLPESNRATLNVTLTSSVTQSLAIIPANTEVTADQNNAVSVPFAVTSNLAGEYRLTAIAPEGWGVSLTDKAITVRPASGTQSGNGKVRLFAQSNANPSIIARAEVLVGITPTVPGITLEVPPDPIFTVSYLGAELPTAYRAVIHNFGPIEGNYNLKIANVTPGWEVITSAADVTLSAGTTGIVGIYLRPTGSTLPSLGSPVSFIVTATSTSDPVQTETVNIGFAMPSVAATFFTPGNTVLSAIPNSTVDSTISIHNFGNISETVSLTANALPTGYTLTGLPQTVTLSPGQIVEFPYSVTVADTVALNSTAYLNLTIDKLRTGSVAAQYLNISIRVLVPGAEAIANASLNAAQLGELDLANRLNDLSFALTNFVVTPTDPIANSQAVAALDAVIRIVDADPILSPLYVSNLTFARDLLEVATTTSEVQDALDFLASQLTSMSQTLTDMVEHGFTLGLATNVVTALPGVPARFPILLENKGTEATTFDFSVGGFLPSDATAIFSQSTVTLQPGERLDGGPSGVTLSLSFTENSLFPTGFTVIATPQEAISLAQQASASVAVRAEFIQVATVTPTPAFTEPGGSVAISARILNVVNREQVVLVSYRVTDKNGLTVFTSPAQSVTLNVRSSLIEVALPAFDTTALARSDYTITVLVTDASATPFPGASGQVALLVGTPVSATLAVSPDSLLSTTSIVTNTLRLDARTVMPNPLTLLGQVQTLPTATTILVNGNIAYVAGTNGIDIVNVANPSAPQVVGTFGQGQIVQGGFNVVRALSGDRIIVATRGTLNAATFTLLTYSIANPTAPVLLGQSTIAEQFITDLFVVGNRALATTYGILFMTGNVISQFGDVLSLDLANPAAVTVSDELFGNATDDYNQNGGEVVDASTLYVASTTSTGGFQNTQVGEGVVRVIDYSNPANLSEIRDVTIPGTVQVLEIAVEGNRALVVGSTGGWKSPFLGEADAQLTGRMTLTLLDITDRRNPFVLGTTLVTESLNRPIDTADGGAKLSTLALGNGRFAISRGYVDGKPVLLLADIASDAIVVASIGVPSLLNEMAIVDGKLYTTSQSGLLIYNVGAIEGTTTTVSVQVPNSNTFPNVNRVRANSFNIRPDQIIPGAGSDTLVWNRPLAFGTTSSTLTWQTDISGLVPGESRDVTTGTNIAFTHAGTPGAFALPATSVVGQNAVAISPASQTVAPETSASYTVTLTNPTDRFLRFTLSTSGVPSSWVDLTRDVIVDANSTKTETLKITAPASTPNGSSDFVVFASANGASQGTAQGTLVLDGVPIPPTQPDSAAHGVVAAITPSTALAGQGTDATYVVRLTNTGSETETFALSSVLPVGVTGAFESTLVTIPPGTNNFREITLVLTPSVGTATGQFPFSVVATSTNSSATNSATATLQVVANGVSVELNSSTGTPGDSFQITVTNTGTVADTFDVKTAGPAGGTAVLSSSQLTLAPNQSQIVNVTTASVDFAVPGTFNFTVFARSQSIPEVVDSDSVELDIQATKGLASRFDPAAKELSTPGNADFLLFVDNIGNTEDSYTATISAINGPITANLIGLNGQSTQTIPVFRLPGLASGAIQLNAGLANAGQGSVRIQIRSLTDGTLLSESTATLSALAGPPVAVADSFALNQGIQANLDLLLNDRQVGSPFNRTSLQFRDGPSHASVTLASDGTVVWTPDPAYYGLDSFSYRAADSNGLFSNWVLVSIAINGRPVAREDEAYVGISGATLVEVLQNDNDPDGLINDTTIEILSSVDPAIGQVDVINNMLRFVPSPTFNSSLTVQYRVIDNKQASSAPASVLMGVYNQNPFNPLDVDRDTFVSPLDVLLTINSLNSDGVRRIAPGNNTAPFYDVNADGVLSPLDTLTIINYLNARGNANRPTGEGEQAAPMPFAAQFIEVPCLATVSLEKRQNAPRASVELFHYERTRSLSLDLKRRWPEGNTVWEWATGDQTVDTLATDFVFANMARLELGEILDNRGQFSGTS
jgi:uncharacterized membrane protein